MSERDTLAVYARLLDAWNRRDAAGFAALFTDTGLAIGFDGSPMQGRDEIARQLAAIFAHHQTASYLAKVRSVRPIAAGVTVLHAAVGMIPPGHTTINPAVNALQTIVTSTEGEATRIVLLQNTPAAFHGRPHLAEQLTAELTALAATGRVVTID